MDKFVINKDLFGCYAWLPIWDRSGITKIDTYVFKIINMHESNSWVDVKNIYWDTEPKLHDCDDDLEIVLDVIQCGIFEKEVITVALKDAERLEDGNHNEINKEKLLCGEVDDVAAPIGKKPVATEISSWANEILYKCPKCGSDFRILGAQNKYCFNCGQKIDWSNVPDKAPWEIYDSEGEHEKFVEELNKKLLV